MKTPQQFNIDTPYMRFAACEWGDPNGKVVLALHGWLDNAASFAPLAQHLTGIRLIAVDLAGHGLSDHRPAGANYALWHYVEDLVYIVEALKLQQFGLIGHSMGAIICTMAASAVLQDQVTALLAIDGLLPFPRAPEHATISLRNYIQQRRLPADKLPVTRYRSEIQAIRARMLGQYKVSRQSATLLAERGLNKVDKDAWIWTADPRAKFGSPARFTEAQALAFAQQVTCPLHLVYVEQGECAQTVQHYQSLLLNVSLYPLEGSHHLHMDGQAEVVAKLTNKLFK